MSGWWSSGRIRAAARLAGVLAIGGLAFFVYHRYIRLSNFAATVPGHMYRSRQPRHTKYWVLPAHGIRRVISLRGYDRDPALLAEERAACRAIGAEFVNVPIETLLPTRVQVEDALRAMRGSSGPVMVHCEHGRDRTSLLLAAYHVMVDDWSVEQAITDQMVAYKAELPDDKLRGIRNILHEVAADRAGWRVRTASRYADVDVPDRPARGDLRFDAGPSLLDRALAAQHSSPAPLAPAYTAPSAPIVAPAVDAAAHLPSP